MSELLIVAGVLVVVLLLIGWRSRRDCGFDGIGKPRAYQLLAHAPVIREKR